MRLRKKRRNRELLTRLKEMLYQQGKGCDGFIELEDMKKLKEYTQAFVGERCSVLQEINEKSNNYMASLINKSESTWLGIVSGRRAFDLAELLVLVAQFDVGLDYFFNGIIEGITDEKVVGEEYFEQTLIPISKQIRSKGLKYASTRALLVMMEACLEVLKKRYL